MKRFLAIWLFMGAGLAAGEAASFTATGGKQGTPWEEQLPVSTGLDKLFVFDVFDGASLTFY
jgi:hypothetical protein